MVKTKVEPMVQLNINPCKMCMPMGAVTAFYGIKKCMSILHGSQGCSTYIRRHMATHYNEPVDIGSSSLTEQGTIYGGEKNLIKGLNNMITLYHPEVIGVATTCLAETIGEDVPRIIDKFYEEHPEHKNVFIIPVNSPGYGGTQFEGYYRALSSIVKNVPMDQEKNNKINVIVTMLSPKDIRFLKKAFQRFGLEAIFLPDLSENLDGVFRDTYERLPLKGTPLSEIKKMAGARMTIEITNMELDYGPGKYLEEVYQVPLRRINIPTGLRDTDAFYGLLSEISRKPVLADITEERGRYVDAMVDGHKYNGEGRAAIFGDPDFVFSTVRLCAENGIMPLVCATGSEKKEMARLLEPEIKAIAERYYISRYEILDDVDFKVIETMAENLNANLLIGNSDGRRIEESLQIPLVRRSFPIHDRVGGQRLVMTGYEGSMSLLDDISNAMLSRKERGFRKEIYNQYYKGSRLEKTKEKESDLQSLKADMEEKTKTHPCFAGCGSGYARMHLPVAPKCNIQCNYCIRKFDCPNESRPGVTTKILTPEEALEKYKKVKEKIPNLTVVGIAGPGDALANFEETKRTIELIRRIDDKVTFCLSTNGLMLPHYAMELCQLGVSHVTVTINAVDISIGAKIYDHIVYNNIRYQGESAAAILMANQLSGLKILAENGVICKVNIVTLKGINDNHIEDIVKKVKELGCYVTNIMPLIPVEGCKFENLPVISNKELNKLRNQCGETLKQMYHCRQCRADAIGTLEADRSLEFENNKDDDANQECENNTYRFAVSSKSGMLVDQHFGHVNEFYIYEYKNGQAAFIEKRTVHQYCEGIDECDDKTDKMDPILTAIKDCNGIIVLRIGDVPKKRLKKENIMVFTTYDRIEDAVKTAANKIIKE